MKRFKQFEVDELGRILNNPNLSQFEIHCRETTEHSCDILQRNVGDIQFTFYRDPENSNHWGAEIYYIEPGTNDIKYSRNYPHLKNYPKKYEPIIKELMDMHTPIFARVIMVE